MRGQVHALGVLVLLTSCGRVGFDVHAHDGGLDAVVGDGGLDADAGDGGTEADAASGDGSLPDGAPIDASGDADTAVSDAMADASPTGCNPTNCPDPFACEGDLCVFECTGVCLTPIQCPAGTDCVVRCGGIQSCMASIDCGDARSCLVECSGAQSCSGRIDCGSAPVCDVSCTASQSCTNTIDCTGSADCDVYCTTFITCAGMIQCSGTQCIECAVGACTGGVSCLRDSALCE